MCERECPGQGDGQDHPAGHHKWSHLTLGPVEYPQRLSEPGGGQAGQDNRGGEMRKGQKDGSTHPECTLPGP